MIDAYVLRTMVRRCNYKPKLIKQARQALIDSIDEYNPNNVLNKRYEYTKMAVVVLKRSLILFKIFLISKLCICL